MINLSTIAQPRDKMGKKAVDLILDQIEFQEKRNLENNNNYRSPSRILLKPEFKIRGTT